MERNEIIFRNAVEIAEMIRVGIVSSLEVVTAFIEQIERLNRKYNAVVLLNKEQALEEAKKADAELLQGKIRGRLHGVPVTFKDNYRTKGIVTTAGFRPLRKYIPDEDAAAVTLVKREGGIIIGKTNLPILAYDTQCFNNIFGRTNNPWDISLTPGGSSGGCATALATGMTPLSFGNDLAGSIRVPAAFCGVYGFMPTWGTTSLRGTIADPFEKTKGLRSVAAAGPLARSIEDIELGLDIMAQHSPNSRRMYPLVRTSGIPDIHDLRIAWYDSLGGQEADEETAVMIREYVKRLSEAGAEVVKTAPDLDFYTIWRTWGRITGMMGGYFIPNMMRSVSTVIFRRLVRNVPMLRDLPRPVSLKEYMRALSIQDQAINRFERFMKDFDAFLCPVTLTPPFRHHEPDLRLFVFNIYRKPVKYRRKEYNYYMNTQSQTTPFNLMEAPVLSMPLGINSQKLPVGIQVAGKRFSDFRLLQTAKVLRRYTRKFSYPEEEKMKVPVSA